MSARETPRRGILPAYAAAVAVAVGVSLASATPTGANAERRFVGIIRFVNATAGELTISQAGRTRLVRVAPETRIHRGKEGATLASLRRGERVVVSLYPEPDDRARIVSLANPEPGAPGLLP